MTRVIIFGDLHANWEALLALQQAEQRPDLVLCLGDIVGYGPDPKRCLDAVRANAAHLIGGRHDRAVSTRAATVDGAGSRNSDHELLEASWAHARVMLSADDRDYLASLPAELTVEVAGARFCLARYSPDDSQTETQLLITMPQKRLQELVDGAEADFIVLGGPHIPALRQVNDRLIICPGSLGMPRYGVSDPTYAAWQDGRVQVHHLHYQFQHTVRKIALLPLAPEHMLRLQSILSTGGLE